MKGDEAKQVATYMDQAAYAYRQFFDLDDIQNMTEFYLTEAGQAYAFGEDLSAKQKGELAQVLASDTGESWAAYKTEVEEDLAQTRRDWSAQVCKEKSRSYLDMWNSKSEKNGPLVKWWENRFWTYQAYFVS